jgi:glutamate synthase (NADPH/NADH) small chain
MAEGTEKKTRAPRQEMPTQDAQVRIHNFNEVATGYTMEMALTEAKRCLQCKKPSCVDGCPVEVPIPQFIGALAKEDFEGAIRELKSKNNLPAICGRVCPQETQCEVKCVLGKKFEPVAVGRLERWIADWELQKGVTPPQAPPPTGKKVAIIGAGPAGLTCAADLARQGHKVVIFEALHEAGGVLMYGNP